MTPLPHREKLLVEAAEGWLMLGNQPEANNELEQIEPAFRCHPTVLAIRWQVYASAECWEPAWVVAKSLCDVLPDRAEVWVCQANTLRKYRGVREARDLLLSIADCFPSDPVIRYNLACYASQLGYLEEACRWLLRAFDMRDSFPLKLAAVYDPDLKPLWEHVGHGQLLTLDIEFHAQQADG